MGVKASSPASLGGIEFDSVITKDEQLTAEAPDFATEKGYSVGDTIIIKPTTLSIEAVVANRPVTWFSRHGSSANRISEVTRQLRKMFVDRKLVTYSANGDTWDNMAIVGLSIPDDAESGDSIKVSISLKQITVTEKQTALVTVSFPRGGTSGTNAGSVSSKKSTSKSSSSVNAKNQYYVNRSSKSSNSTILNGLLNGVSNVVSGGTISNSGKGVGGGRYAYTS